MIDTRINIFLYTPLLLVLPGVLSCNKEAVKPPELVYHEYHYDRFYTDNYRVIAAFRFAETPDLPPALRRTIQNLLFAGLDYQGYAEMMMNNRGGGFIDKGRYRFDLSGDFYDSPAFEELMKERWPEGVEAPLFEFAIRSDCYDIVFVSGDFIVFQNDWSDSPSDGTHGNFGRLYQTADLKSGKIIQLEDVLPLQNLAETEDAIRTLLHEQGIYPETLYPGGLPRPDSFIFEGPGLRLVWQPYSIAAYALGVVSVLLPYGAVENSLTGDGRRLMREARRMLCV